ncbi:transposase [Caloramator sp. mosi_1]|uniref:IS66 family transposase n=1 Tax=Caloramator sp. mosi_1 TaxID=3023090 RepID=UPI002362683F|nr:transposase [Caloramator sp. mosi_1]WDC83344.1 transposase [Caloramator sp. mosi_1]
MIIDNVIESVEKETKSTLQRSPLGKTLDHAKNHLPRLKKVLLDVFEVDNNAAERAIKPFVIGRKNFLFANTAKGATASSIIYSIIETAKANNLVVEKYLIYLFDNLSKIDMQDSDSLGNLMPWSHKIPEDMKIKYKK